TPIRSEYGRSWYAVGLQSHLKKVLIYSYSAGRFWRCISWRQHSVAHAVDSERILQPKSVLMLAQTVIGRTIHTPFAQNVARRGGTQLHFQHTILHAIVHFRDFRPGLVRVWHQLQFDDAIPLYILGALFMRRHGLTMEHHGMLDTSQDKVAKLL